MAAGRPIWKGTLSFGLVSVPVQLSSLEAKEDDLDFTMLDKRDQHRIRYLRVNEKTGKEVPWKDIVKGHEVRSGHYVVVTPEDLKRAAPKATRTIDITDFVPKEDVEPWYFERPYALDPSEEGHKGYALLCAALKEPARLGIAKIVLHSRQHLAAVFPQGNRLMLNTMRFPAELRKPAEGARSLPGKATGREVELARALIDGMTAGWDPSKYHDEYREALRKWLAKRAKSGDTAEVEDAEEEDQTPGPYNIMDLLKKSIDEQKRHGGRRSTAKPAPRRKAG